MRLEVKSVILICDRNTLINRWENDKTCEWRTHEWLAVSLKSLLFFSFLENCIDTSGLTIDMIEDRIMR